MNFVLITLALTCFVCVHSASWSYDDTSKWGDNYAACKGSKQSPVDIDPKTVTKNPNLGKFKITNFDSEMQYNINNNGHTIQLNPLGKTMTASGGGLPGTYKVAQFHFHWSSSDTDKGSEHTIGKSAYPLEIHIVQMNTAYTDVKEALKHSDGLAVFGFFFEEGQSNKGLAKFTSKMPEHTKDSSSATLSIKDIVGMANMDNYYRYEGSLTTPPCSEAVVWTVFKDILTASKSEIAAFRNIKGHDNSTITNFRPVQKLNGRKIYTSIGSSECHPTVSVDFKNPRDMTPQVLHVIGTQRKYEPTALDKYVGVFDGKCKIVLTRFTFAHTQPPLAISVRYRLYKTHGIQKPFALVSNGNNAVKTSILIAATPSYVEFGLETFEKGYKSLKIQVSSSDWESAGIIYTGQELIGQVGDILKKVPHSGTVVGLYNSLVIGVDKNCENFNGEIDYVKFFKCYPHL